jgi:filamentous hemagglutinin
MKMKIATAMIALLSLSMLVLGCDTGTNSDSGGGASNWPPATTPGGGSSGGSSVQDAQNLAAALGGTAVGNAVFLPAGATIPAGAPFTVPAGVTLQPEGALTVEGTLILEGDLTMKNGDLTVEGTLTANGTVTVPATSSVKVDPNAVLTVTGDLNTAGALTVEGTLNAAGNVTVSSGANFTVDAANGEVTVTGDFTLESGAHCTVEGDIDVGNGGTLTFEDGVTGDAAGLAGEITVGPGATLKDLSHGGGSLWGNTNSGKYVYQAGSTAIVANDPGGGAPWVISMRIGAAGDEEATIQLTRGTLTMEATTTGAGKITLDGDATLAKSYGITGTSEVTIATNSKLTVSATGEFNLQETATKIGGTDATSVIEIAAGGYIKVHTGNTAGDIFYNNSDTNKVSGGTPGPSGRLEVTPNTYKWDANAGGSGIAGWKAQS